MPSTEIHLSQWLVLMLMLLLLLLPRAIILCATFLLIQSIRTVIINECLFFFLVRSFIRSFVWKLQIILLLFFPLSFFCYRISWSVFAYLALTIYCCYIDECSARNGNKWFINFLFFHSKWKKKRKNNNNIYLSYKNLRNCRKNDWKNIVSPH